MKTIALNKHTVRLYEDGMSDKDKLALIEKWLAPDGFKCADYQVKNGRGYKKSLIIKLLGKESANPIIHEVDFKGWDDVKKSIEERK